MEQRPPELRRRFLLRLLRTSLSTDDPPPLFAGCWLLFALCSTPGPRCHMVAGECASRNSNRDFIVPDSVVLARAPRLARVEVNTIRNISLGYPCRKNVHALRRGRAPRERHERTNDGGAPFPSVSVCAHVCALSYARSRMRALVCALTYARSRTSFHRGSGAFPGEASINAAHRYALRFGPGG